MAILLMATVVINDYFIGDYFKLNYDWLLMAIGEYH
jgi:hypothetical protein